MLNGLKKNLNFDAQGDDMGSMNIGSLNSSVDNNDAIIRGAGTPTAGPASVVFNANDAALLSSGSHTVIATHSLATNPLFTDDSLEAILDDYPSEKLFVLTMGTDPTNSSENERLDRSGVSGAELLAAVRKGRMWLNVTGIDSVDPRFRRLTDDLYASVNKQTPGTSRSETHATLLVSSPGAMVYYHVDGPPSYLWHIRGEKRVWVYPALDEQLLSRELLEDVFAGARQEYVPYEVGFDDKSTAYDLQPGQVAMWPQNAPHRVTNGDSFNVSLVTDHFTPEARRRARIYRANQFLRTKGHVPHRFLTTDETGITSSAKVVVYKVGQKIGLGQQVKKAHKLPTRRVDPLSPNGIGPIDREKIG
jgi:hypothetical protein